MGRCWRIVVAAYAVLMTINVFAMDVAVVAAFNPAAFETPESIQFDRQGNAYISMALTGEIRKIAPGGTQSTFAVLPIHPEIQPCANNLGFAVMGSIALDHRGNVYASVISCDPQDLGVWKVTPEGHASLIGKLPPNAGPNGIAYHGEWLYVSDTLLGLMWRIHSDGTRLPEIWTNDGLLQPVPLPLTPGPNGVQVFREEVYVAVSDRQHVLAFPIQADGSPGPARIHVSGVAIDDFAFDVKGNLYGTTDPSNTVLRIAPSGAVEVLLTANDGLDGPTAAAFGVGSDNTSLYVTNAAFPFFQGPDPRRPSVLRLSVETPGDIRP